MLLKIHPQNPEPYKIDKVVEVLKKGGVVIYPTDTVYGMGCDIFKQRAVERICRLKGVNPDKAQFSFICSDLSHLSQFSRQVSTPVFKLMKKALPGPFTFILEASSNVPGVLLKRKKTVGIRIPDNTICQEIVRRLGNPIITTSVLDKSRMPEYTNDPELIYERYGKEVDIIVDGGMGNLEPSTVVECIHEEIKVVRQGIGLLEQFL